MKTTLLIIIGCISITIASAQSGKLKKADNYYNHLSYSYAAPIYQGLIGSEVDSPTLKSKLATSYYHLGDMKKSEEYFAQVVTTPEATNEDLFYYAQTLKQNGNYAKSDEWMSKFHQKSGTDKRAASYVKNDNYLAEIQKQGARFKIKNLDVNTSSADFGGYPSADGKNSYFVSSRRRRVFVQNEWGWNSRRFLDLYKSDIATDQQMVNAHLISRKVNTKFHEGPLCYTNDGKTVYFTRNNIAKRKNRKDAEGIQNLKLYRSTIDEEGNWKNEEILPFNSKDYSVGHPALSPDGKTMYFASDMPGGFGGADIYKVSVAADGTLGKPENLGAEHNTEGQEMFPWISKEGNLFYSSNGLIGLGGLDVFVALADKSGALGKAMNVGLPVNGNKDDFAFTMNADNATGYFSSNRDGGKGDDDIYSFTLLKPFKKALSVEGIVADKNTKAILPRATVNLLDATGKIVSTIIAGENGEFTFPVEPEMDYSIAAQKEDYFDNQGSFTTKNIAPEVEVINKDIPLEKDPGLALYALVTDSKTKAPLDGVTMKIIDNITGKEFIQVITPQTGDALRGIMDKKVGDQVSYQISLSKDGYFPKTVTFNSKIEKPGVINVADALDLGLDKSVTDLSQLIQINPINFDLNKYVIRPDAQVELNKIIDVMNKYPEMEIELGSHTDCRASIAYNEKLSDNRAKVSAAYIKSKITNPERIYGKGYGESRLLNSCACEGAVKSDCSEEEHEKNRRTEFRVISTGGDVKVINSSTDSFGEQGNSTSPKSNAISADGKIYTVQPGETLYRVFINTGVKVETLSKLNNLKSNDIRAGQVLKLN